MDRRNLRHSRHTRRSRDDESITGLHAVAEALAAGERFERIVIGEMRTADPAVQAIVRAAKSAGIPVAVEGEGAFRRFGSDRHQHVAGVVKRYAYASWEDVRTAVRGAADALVVVLDHIEDPQNLGAVMRNAEGAGATAVVIPDRRSAAVTPAARRAAAGAASHLRVAVVPNLARTLTDLKADGCWVYGLSTGEQAATYTQVDMRGRCVLVVGAEGKGLSRVVAERCDRLVEIPLHGKVKSLNASSAAAVALFEARRQRA
jgi:23S rRNA (guanosine2251-2'-O)-methyltransferase